MLRRVAVESEAYELPGGRPVPCRDESMSADESACSYRTMAGYAGGLSSRGYTSAKASF